MFSYTMGRTNFQVWPLVMRTYKVVARQRQALLLSIELNVSNQ
jgi:hypothetical protein